MRINTDKIYKLIELLGKVQDELGSCPLVPRLEEPRFEQYEERMSDVDDVVLIKFAKTVCIETTASKVHDRESALLALYNFEYDYSVK